MPNNEVAPNKVVQGLSSFTTQVDTRGKHQLPRAAREALGIRGTATRLLVRVDEQTPGKVVLETPWSAVRRLREQLSGVVASGDLTPGTGSSTGSDSDSDSDSDSTGTVAGPLVVDARVIAALLAELSDVEAERLTNFLARVGGVLSEGALGDLRARLARLYHREQDPLDSFDDPTVSAVLTQVIEELALIGVSAEPPDHRQLELQNLLATTPEPSLTRGETFTLALSAAKGYPALLASTPSSVHPVLQRLAISVVDLQDLGLYHRPVEPATATAVESPDSVPATAPVAESAPHQTAVRTVTGDSPIDDVHDAGSADVPLLLSVLHARTETLWRLDAIAWTDLQAAAEQHGMKIKSREQFERELTSFFDGEVPRAHKTSRAWTYKTVELWSAINDAYLRHAGRLPGSNQHDVEKFVALLTTALRVADQFDEKPPTQAELVTGMRQAGASVPRAELSRLHWIIRNRRDRAEAWVAARS